MLDEIKKCFPPSVNASCTKLILGSMPGDESLRCARYYAHPRNAFWPLMADLFDFQVDTPYETRLRYLLDVGIALWDTVASGARPGSLDSNIDVIEPNDFTVFLGKYPRIKTIFFNGKTAYNFFVKYNPDLSRGTPRLIVLPSTSPACAMLDFAAKRQKWQIITSS